MTTVRYGLSCDGEGCPVVYNDYDVGDIVTCEDCLKDLCKSCREKTGHVMVREVCCGDCPGPAASCEER